MTEPSPQEVIKNDLSQEHDENRHPKAFAGGWQGLDIVGQQELHQAEKQNPHANEAFEKPPKCWTRTAQKFPRTHNILMKIIIPLLLLICLCFACGAGLARLEWNEERKANDATMADYANLVFWVDQIRNFSVSAPKQCLKQYEYTGDSFNKTDLEIHMEECGQRFLDQEMNKTMHALTLYFVENEFDSITFNWMECKDETNSYSDRIWQAIHMIQNWQESYQGLRNEYEHKNISTLDAHLLALDEATGTDSCNTNYAAGALFWFTIMTTIGYGNTAPATEGGRYMVYTLGFCSILIFTGLIGQAGSVVVTIVDDALLRCKYFKRLTKGLLASVCWLGMLLLWMLVIAGIVVKWSKERTGFKLTLDDAYWFTFISTTTVGLGDIYIPHENFVAADLFYIPLIFLIAFVLLATFLLKFSIMVASWFPQKSKSLSAVLQESREEQERARSAMNLGEESISKGSLDSGEGTS